MRRVVFIVFVLVALAFTNKDTAIKNTSVVVSSKSTLVVKGTTNVNSFKCLFNVQKLKNPIPITYFSNGDKLKFQETALVLDSECFDCGGKAINRDFQKILKSEIYPKIKLILKETTSLENVGNVQTLVDVEIAGVKREYKIPVTVKNNNATLINGALKVCLSDYNLEQPKKMFGLITVDNEISIDFNLVVE